ncbi:PREDICTED: OTU domain-containing protein 6A [Chinchilla lanigera]|uniref:OTU domain-containing protein 6A n=1 Tax=Chinchilla lanigera TaxID=34839 RepID=UPI00038E9B33|nr:PREDICTED: OTU domain-containing protein 6A [Chinchilla lanigera]
MEDLQSERQRMLRRHHREKKELEAQIQSMKCSVPKSDKKRRKEVRHDVARLQAEMEQRHQQELEKFQENFPGGATVDSVTENLAKMNLENRHPHVSRAQKRREKMEALEREHQERVLVAEMEHLASFRHEEEEKLSSILAAKYLEMKDIPADSQCMYRAVQDQLVFSVTVESLRRRTADYMREHVDDFLPFFSDPETGDAYSLPEFMAHCDDIVRRRAWGGLLELRALSHVLQTPIEVIQASAPALLIGEEYRKKPLTLVYLHYACSLGEHYNSVKPLEAGAAGGPAPRLL